MQSSVQVNIEPPSWLRTRTRRKATAIGLAAALLVPGLVIAGHQFTDPE